LLTPDFVKLSHNGASDAQASVYLWVGVAIGIGTIGTVAGAAIRNFRIGRHFRIESNQDVRFEFESNLEASQVPTNERIDSVVMSLVGWSRP